MWILIAMIALMPFEENPYLYISDDFLGIFPKFTVIKLLGLIGLAWSAVRALQGFGLGLFSSGQTKAFLVFLGAVVFAGLASGAGLLTVTRLLAIVCLLPLVLSAVRREADLVRVLKACALVIILIFPYALRQVIRFGGRLGVGLHESNYFALILVLLLPLPFTFARQEKVAWKRWLWIAGIGVILLELILTGSRGGFLGLLVVLGLLCARMMRRTSLALGAMAGVLLILLAIVPNPLAQRLLASGLDREVQDTSVAISNQQRLAVLKAGLRMISAHPLAGVGLGKFKGSVEKYGGPPRIAHCTYVELAAELGVSALLAFLVLIYATLRSLGRSRRLATAAGNMRLRDLSLGLEAGLAGYLVGALFLSAQYEKFFWLVLFLSICLERIARRTAKQAKVPVAREALRATA